MKVKNEKKLRLGKQTIRNIDTGLNRDEQKKVKGGTRGTTQVPIYCKP
jgi:hypothetical protein